MLTKKILTITFFLSCLPLFGQLNIDSLLTSSKHSTGENKAKAYLQIANEYLKSQPDSSIYFGLKAVKTASILENHTIIGRSYSIVAEAHQLKNELQSATEYYLKAIQIGEEHQITKILGSAYNGLGINYFYLNDMPKAEKYVQKAADVKLAEEDYTYYTVILTNLAYFYFHKEQYNEAIKILKPAEKVLLDEDKGKYLPSVYNSLGANHQQLEPGSDSAEYYYKKSIHYSEKYSVVDNIITGYHNLGELYYIRNEYQKAIHFLKKAEKESEKMSADKYKLGIYQTLSEIYEKTKDYSNSLKYKKKQFKLYQSTFTFEKQKAIDELEIKYETAKKEQEIQAQKEEIQLAKLKAEKEKNKFYLILFIGIILILISVFVSIFIIQRRKNARKIEQEKLKIFENIVHDIRTPVTLIKGPLQLIKKDFDVNHQHSTNIQLIEKNAEKLVTLVNELLDASKLDNGKYQIMNQTGNIDLFIKNILSSFTSESKEKRIQIEYASNQSIANHTYCATIIEKVINNIVSNSLKYCPPESVVTVTSSLLKNELQLTISDNGNGIPKKEQSKVFERFYRLKEHKTTTTGTGIGLSLTSELVRLVNGTITLTSEVSKGTTFQISVPVKEVKTEEKTEEFDESKIQLLLCEDDPDIVVFIRNILQDNFSISVASNGEEGSNKFQEILPDIVLSDIMMPIKDGIELLQEIKTNELTNHTPVVLFSAKSSLESRLRGLKYGADGYISKPFNPDELRLVIQNLIQTIQRNKQEFLDNIQTKKSFEERLKSSNEYVNKAINFVVINIEDYQYSVNELAADMCISRSQLHRKLTNYTGFSTSNFIRMIRLEKAKDMLVSNQGNVTEIAYACGFNSQSYFSTQFAEYFGETPSKLISKL